VVPEDRHARGHRQTVQGHRQTSGQRHLDHRHSQYAGRACDDDLRRQLWAQPSAATTRLELIRAERSDAKRNALDEAIAPLLAMARSLRTTAERDALAAYVIRKIAGSR
jgi:hypothetical protein